MPLSNGGLTKMCEECGELIQIAAKKISYPDTDGHPDGAGSISGRLADEIADVIAACTVVIAIHGLDGDYVHARAVRKQELFVKWHQEVENANP